MRLGMHGIAAGVVYGTKDVCPVDQQALVASEDIGISMKRKSGSDSISSSCRMLQTYFGQT
jgi:hypothetical protein